MMANIANLLSTEGQEVLWKDIWWIKSMIFFLTFVSSYIAYKVLMIVFRFLNGERRNVESHGSLPPLFQMAPSTSPVMNAVAQKKQESQQQQSYSFDDSTGFKQMSQNKTELDDNVDQFYDLLHHGIKFYNDNASSCSRQHRQRMHSTMSMSNSIQQRHCQRAVINPPPFPKLNGSEENGLLSGSYKPYFDRHLHSGDTGDMKFSKSISSRLNTITEDGIRDTSVNFEVSNNCKWKDQNLLVHSQKTYNGANNDNEQQYNAKSYKSTFSKCENGSDKNSAALYTASINRSTTPFPPDKFYTDNPNSNNLECFVCKSKIHCLCKKCSSISEGSTKGFINVDENTYDEDEQDDFLDNHEEFIDENFEDMERISIVSDEITREVTKEIISPEAKS